MGDEPGHRPEHAAVTLRAAIYARFSSDLQRDRSIAIKLHSADPTASGMGT
jgi:hypothetical protein